MFDVRGAKRQAPGDQYSRALDEELAGKMVVTGAAANKLDSEESRKVLRKLLQWYYLEREKQSANRLEMAMDCDFYDNLQWDPEDAQALRDRGQMPLVYNEVAPMVDWIIGTERRTRVDWNVLPRTEDDVPLADAKTKVLKYASDVNRVQFARSKAFADAAKAGVGWLDDGARDDPTTDILYSRYEDWRCVLWDSASYELDLGDARYLFRWRWVDVDIAVLMFPDRENQIRMAAEESGFNTDGTEEEDTWISTNDPNLGTRSGRLMAQGAGMVVDAKRQRVKLIEAQWREPSRVRLVADGPFKGSALNDGDRILGEMVASNGYGIIDRLMMRVHVAVMTEAHLLTMGPSPYRHNRFSLTPVWCYRRSRDRLPYGVVRRVRDIQQDLNKRASKALFMLNTNQIIADEGATDDWNLLREEADRPDGLLIKKAGKELQIRRDTDAATGQIQMMTLAAQSIQKSAGVSQENMGRQTNAVSGEAIKARQLQGSVVTTEPFDNLRLAVQVQGEKQLSMAEQFYTEEKVIRLTGAKGALEWAKVNQPELQVDGSVRILNDIAASQADFVVQEADYAGTLRQVMFESLNQLASRLPPEVSLRLMTIAFEFSDLPNKDEIAEQFRKITGERDPNKDPSPEEAQQMEQQMQQQAEALQMQRQQAMTALEEGAAKVREINARAAKLEAEAQAAMAPGDGGQQSAELSAALQQVQAEAGREIDGLTEQVRKLQSQLANETMRIQADKDTKVQVARIQADGAARAAEIQAASDAKLAGLMDRIDKLQTALQQSVGDARREAEDRAKEIELKAREAKASEAEKAAKAPAPAPVAAPAPAPAAPPVTINVQVDAKSGEVKKSITVERDADGKVTGATVAEEPANPSKK
jgi:hypothetical protein